MGDRSGSREPKGASLKKSKKNPGASAARVKTLAKPVNSGPACSLIPPAPGDELYFDAGVALLSRQFDRDRERVIARAKSDGNCSGMLLWFADIDKQTAIADLCKANSGLCYYSTGIHPDNIDRTNKKSHEEWLEKTEELAKRSECLALMSGLNLSREMGTHFAQESLLKSACALAEKLMLPLVLHINDCSSLERAIEILRGEGWANEEGDESGTSNRRVLLHDAMTSCEGDSAMLSSALQAGFHLILAATGLTDADPAVQAKAQACVKLIPPERLVIGTDSPWKTPQNLEDPYLRTLRNEPSNIAAIVSAIADASGTDRAELAATVRANTLRVFGLEFLSSAAGSAAAGAAGDEAVDELADQLKGAEVGSGAAGEEPDEAVEDAPAAATEKSGKPKPSGSGYYSCVKCRSRLFALADLHSHDLSAVKTVFKVGEEGLCASNVFLKVADNREIAGRSGLCVRGSNVECKSCGQKLGKYSAAEAHCACGVAVGGPVTKVNATKIDFFDGSTPSTLLTLEELSKKAQQENEELARQEQLREEEAEEARLAQGGKVKKTKKMKSENKGNFSSFRNKTFIPNASRNAPGMSAGKTSKKQPQGNSMSALQADSDEGSEDEDS